MVWECEVVGVPGYKQELPQLDEVIPWSKPGSDQLPLDPILHMYICIFIKIYKWKMNLNPEYVFCLKIVWIHS